MERDETTNTRLILYENTAEGRKVQITHRSKSLPPIYFTANFPVPRGCIRFEDDDLADKAVSFLDAHDITVHNSEGYKVYRLHAIYQFVTVPQREDFLVQVRERELLGRYFAETVTQRKSIIAQHKVVRIW